jgi:ABC-type multidrug transport system fused ATPase/permease subunit
VYLRAITFVVASLRLARRIHDAAFWAVLRSPMAYFDTTIKGRITNRFSTDQQKVDLWLRGVMGYLMNTSIQGAASLLVVTITAPHVSVTFLFLAIFYVHAMNYFRRSNRELQRLDSQGASPLYGHFGETLSGVSTIRGFGAERNMREKNLQMLGGACGPSFYQAVLGCWLKIRLQMVASVIILGVAVVAVMAHSAGKENAALAGTLGLSLSYALNLTTHLSGIIFGFTTAETSLVALERLNAFALLPPEPPLALESDPQTEEWPTAGKVEFKKVVMQYREGLDPVLKGLSFKVAPGEKVGIVGRTGAGKSSLLVTLLRLVELKDGQIRIDGRPTSSVGLHALRCRIAIIPQEPVLFSGTLRFNLDPFERHTSDKLWATLADAKLKEFVESRSGGLDMTIEPNGQNLSVGQRQLVCMVRALLCDCKILLLDEATASVDHHTDRLIQATLRDLKGVTTLTIAHRINTILESDRVLVMDDGKAIEFDNPQALIARPGSVFGDIVAQYQADHDASNSSPRSP